MPPSRIALSLEAERDIELLFNRVADDAGHDRAEVVLRRILDTIEHVSDLHGIGRVRNDLTGAPRAFSVMPSMAHHLRTVLPGDEGVVLWRVIDGPRDVPRHVRG